MTDNVMPHRCNQVTLPTDTASVVFHFTGDEGLTRRYLCALTHIKEDEWLIRLN